MIDVSFSSRDKVNSLVKVSRRMGLSADEVLALYLILGDGLFFVFDLLQDRTVKFPSSRSFRQSVKSSGCYNIQKLKKKHYLVNGVEAEVNEIKRGDVVRINGVNFESLGSPTAIFEETYIICKEKADG